MHWLEPSFLPSIGGKVAAFTRNARGNVDGVLLDDARQIHIPPHLGPQVEEHFAVGDTIDARCVRPRGAPVYAAVSVTAADGRTLIDEGPATPHDRAQKKGPPTERPPTRPVEFSGTVRQSLYAPKGEVCGAVLTSGEQLRVDPKANTALAPYFAEGADIRVWREAFERRGTTVVELSAVGYARDFE